MSTKIENAWKELITALALVLDLEEGHNLYHSWRVAAISTVLANDLLPDKKSDVFIAGLLHDVGAMSLPEHIVRYPSLSEQLRNHIIRSHTLIGAQLVSDFPGFDSAPLLILEHHEYWNGHGYPLSKQGKEIAPGAQLIRVADTFDVILQNTSDKTCSGIIKNMKDRADKEYEKSIFDQLEKIMSDDKFFQDISDVSRLSPLLLVLRDDISVSGINEKADIMGTALSVFGQVIDAKHAYTSGHSKRVSKYSLLIAIGMDLPHDEATKIKWAGLMHDIGMVAISQSILGKITGLSMKEHSLIREHPAFTEKILNQISCMKDLVPIASAHHERYDGDGYHKMLKGKDIPLGARILAVADTFDSLTSVRGYKDVNTVPRAIDEIKRKSRTQFDPEVVEAAIPIFQSL